MSLLSRIGDVLAALGSDVKTARRQLSCNVGGIISGAYYDNGFNGSPSSNGSAVGNLLAVVPYVPAVDMTIDRLGIVITTAAGAGGVIELYIYSCLANGWPGSKLLSTGTMAITTTGLKEVTVNFTFEAGKTYWLGFRANASFTYRGVPLTDSKQFGIGSSDPSSVNKATGLVMNLTYPTVAPNTWGAVVFDQFTPMVPPSCRMRAV